jgi:hypothetical protein
VDLKNKGVKLTMSIISFDVGIKNLAFVVVQVQPAFFAHREKLQLLSADDFCQAVLDAQFLQIIHTRHVDLNQAVHSHQQIDPSACELAHGPLICDKVAHFLQDHRPLFNDWCLSTCVVEVQPLTGITSVETLLHHEFRPILERVSPNAMHKWLGTNRLSTYFRKQKILETTRPFLQRWLTCQDDWQHQCDALMFVLYYLAHH